MGRTRIFYVVYTWQSGPHTGQSIASSRITVTDCDKVTNDTVIQMRDTIADMIGASPASMVITFFAEMEG